VKLNKNEQIVLNALRNNPYISQKELSESLRLSRPSIANYISSLQQKGFILGKPYALREDTYVTCIGGANMDITLQLEDMMTYGTSNPVSSSHSLGGVIRNVGENLARLDANVSLMSLVGNDRFGEEILEKSNKIMKVFATERVQGEVTGSYYSVIDQKGDMIAGFANMDINRLMNRSWIIEHKKHIQMSDWVIADLNISKEAMEAVIENCLSEDIKLGIIGVSSPKMKHLPDDLKGVEIIICNKDETQTYFKTNENDSKALCKLWLDAGVKKAIVTAGIEGSFYGEDSHIKHQKAYLVQKRDIIDVTGAGDAFSSATVYGLMSGNTLDKSVQMGAISASLTIQTQYAVNPNVSLKKIQKEIDRYEK
jgi:pseudouridine kinase